MKRLIEALLTSTHNVLSKNNVYHCKPNFYYLVKPVLNYHVEQYIFLTFQTGGCLLLYESSV